GIELALNILAEASATEISKIREPEGFNESQSVAIDGAKVAKEARRNIESKTGHSVISDKNAKSIRGRMGNSLQLPENEA
ncbi:MAG: hypothetical protein LBP68_03555, partial [Acidobacteriota bacterium]|nr:hypothetical protein [Acidobacteriota bacterium]